MSIFYHNDDPLLRQTTVLPFQSNTNNMTPNTVNDTYAQMYKQQLMMEMQQQQQPTLPKDWLSELDNTMKGLDSATIEILNNDMEFNSLNTELQGLIQSEIMSLVKYKINGNDSATSNIRKQIEIIKSASNKVKEQEKQNLSELNDYIKNYPHLTFEEYQKLKQENATAVKSSKKTKNNN